MRKKNNKGVKFIFIFVAFYWLTGCASTYQRATEADFKKARQRLDPLSEDGESERKFDIDGTLESYMAIAIRLNPSLRSAFERWRAARYRIPQARRLPEPTLTYGNFIRRVETRVGPQRHRIGFSMTFPWPTKLKAGADATSIAARSKQRMFESQALSIQRQVAEVYWQLWLIGRTRDIQGDQLEILRGLSEVTRIRVEVNRAILADLNQVELALSRIEDVLSSLDEKKRALSAELISRIGLPSSHKVVINPARVPNGGLPAITEETLIETALRHPRVEALELMRISALSKVRRARAERAPNFMVGFDWIETGNAKNSTTPGSGTDAVIVNLGLQLPLWIYAYRGAEEEARSESEAFRADALAESYRAKADVELTLSKIRDTHRRISLYQNTLIPLAEAAYASVIGAYQAGHSTIAAILLSQRELLDLVLGLARAQAEHAIGWARLEEIVGHEVERSIDDE